MDQAFFLKKKILSGQWDSIVWINREMNLADKTPIEANPSKLEEVAGLYVFNPRDFPKVQGGKADSLQLYLAFKQDKLEAEWSWRNGRKEFLYAENDHSFFSVMGDQYEFVEDGDQMSLRVILYSQNPQEVQLGIRESK